MTAITIRIRDDEDRETIKRLKAVTKDRTAAKALMRAAQLYPDAREELRRTLEQLTNARNDLERQQSALADWQHTRDLERAAWNRLENIGGTP